MIGAVIGDIVGSRFEFRSHKGKEFELFTDECRFTDDSVMTLAVAKALMDTAKFILSADTCDPDVDNYQLLEIKAIQTMQEMGRQYPYCGFGGMFARWVFSDNPQPYHSFGNGAAMRISPVGFIAGTEGQVRQLSAAVTRVTHNHPEGIKGAEATAMAIFLARRGHTKEEIRKYIERHYYALDFTLDDIRDTYPFDVTCQGTVPQAVVAFLESTSFEDAIRNAISLGGDSDTLAAITGGMAEAYYGVPEALKEKALSYLDDELGSICEEWTEFMRKKESATAEDNR